MDFPSWLKPRTPQARPNDYRGRSRPGPQSFVPRRRAPVQETQYRVSDHPKPNPEVTLAEYESGARQIEESAERQLAYAMQVHSYCYEIAQQMRAKGATVAAEQRRSLAMTQRVAEGARELSRFLYDDHADAPLPGTSPEVTAALAEADRLLTGMRPPPSENNAPAASSGPNEAEKGGPSSEEPQAVHGQGGSDRGV